MAIEMKPHYRTALITGASRGIGCALAKNLAAKGTQVVLSGRHSPQLRAVEQEIRINGGRARSVTMDVSDAERTVDQIRALDDELEGLDLVVANAGVGPPVKEAQLSWESMRDVCNVNFTGAIATLTAVLPRFLQRQKGHVVGISSISSFAALPGAAAYCTPKAGLSMFLACLRLDLRSTGVNATSVHAGFVRTEMVSHRKAWLPMIVEPNVMAEAIASRLPGAPATIDFPLPLALIARASQHLPQTLREWMLGARPGGGDTRGKGTSD